MNLKRLIILLVSIFALNISFSQDINSLKNQYNKEENLQLKSSILTKISSIYLKSSQLDSAKVYFIKLAELNEKLNDLNILFTSYYYLGNISYSQGNYEAARSYYKSAYESYSYADPQDKLPFLINYSLAWKASEKYSKSIKYAELALKEAQKQKDTQALSDIYIILYEDYSSGVFKDNAKANNYLLLHNGLKDEITKNQKNDLIQTNQKYRSQLDRTTIELDKASYKLNKTSSELYKTSNELDKTTFTLKSTKDSLKLEELKNERLAQEIELRNLRIEKAEEERKKIITITIIITIALVITSVLLIIIAKLLQSRNRINKELTRLNNTKDKFFSIISHDLKSPIRGIKSLTDLFINRYSKMDDKKKQDILLKINESSSSLYRLLENLLNWSRSQRDKIDFNPEKIDINLIIDDNIKLLENSALDKNIIIKNNIDKEIIIFVDRNMLSTVYRNLISNAIKFTPEKGTINLNYIDTKDSYYFKIIDSGIGIPQENIDKLFKIDQHITTKGTKGELGTGLGLVLCKEFIEKNGGSIFVESEINKGSTFTLKIPKIN